MDAVSSGLCVCSTDLGKLRVLRADKPRCAALSALQRRQPHGSASVCRAHAPPRPCTCRAGSRQKPLTLGLLSLPCAQPTSPPHPAANVMRPEDAEARAPGRAARPSPCGPGRGRGWGQLHASHGKVRGEAGVTASTPHPDRAAARTAEVPFAGYGGAPSKHPARAPRLAAHLHVPPRLTRLSFAGLFAATHSH